MDKGVPTAVILCGGKSSRFGEDKARALIHGKPVLKHLRDECLKAGIKVVAQADCKDKYADLELETFADDTKHEGPLGGIESAFARLRAEALLFMTCDMPAIDAAMIRTLAESYNQCCDSIFFECEGLLQPFPGVITREILPFIEQARNSGNMSVKKCVQELARKKMLRFYSGKAFFNMNTPDDRQEFLGKAGEYVNARNV